MAKTNSSIREEVNAGRGKPNLGAVAGSQNSQAVPTPGTSQKPTVNAEPSAATGAPQPGNQISREEAAAPQAPVREEAPAVVRPYEAAAIAKAEQGEKVELPFTKGLHEQLASLGLNQPSQSQPQSPSLPGTEGLASALADLGYSSGPAVAGQSAAQNINELDIESAEDAGATPEEATAEVEAQDAAVREESEVVAAQSMEINDDTPYVDYRSEKEKKRGFLSSIFSMIMPEPPKQPPYQPIHGDAFRSIQKAKQESAEFAMAKKRYTGNVILEHLVNDDTIPPDAVAVGSHIIREAIRANDNHLLQWVSEMLGVSFDTSLLYSDPDAIVDQLAEVLENNPYWVMTEKFPVNRASSMQNRRLLIVPGDGVYIHSTQAKGYTADFDGDEMSIHFDPSSITYAREGLAFLIDVDGKATLDQKFFPVPPVWQTREEFIEAFTPRLGFTADEYVSIDTESVLNAYYDVCTDNDPDKNDELWEAFVKSMAESALNSDYRATDVASRMLKNLYDTSIYVRQVSTLLILSEEDESVLEPNYKGPTKKARDNKVDELIQDVLLESVQGRPPVNYQDLIVDLTRFVGEVKKANPSFRVAADLLKLINMEPDFELNEENVADFVSHLVSGAFTIMANNKTRMGERDINVVSLARDAIIKKAGYPSRWKDFGIWLDQFIEAYKVEYGLIRAASPTKLTNMMIDKPYLKNNRFTGQNYSDIAAAIVQVYGEYRLEDVFGEHLRFSTGESTRHEVRKDGRMYIGYRSMTVKEFSLKNRIQLNSKKVQGREVGKETEKEPYSPIKFTLEAIADKRTSQASEANTRFENMLTKHLELLSDITEGESDAVTRFKLEAIDLLGVEMFNYYGINDWYSFISSPVFKAIKGAKTTDELGGIYMSMMIDYRFSEIDEAYAARDEIENTEGTSIEQLTFAEGQAMDKITNLQMVSAAWETVMVDWKEGGAIWRNLAKNGLTQTKETEKLQAYSVFKNQKGDVVHSFFGEGPHAEGKPFYEEGKWDTLLDFLKDISVGKEIKQCVLADIVRAKTKFLGYTSYEMLLQLNMTDNPVMSGSYTMMNLEINELMDQFSASSDTADRGAKKNYEKMKKDVDRSYKAFKGQLNEYLSIVAESPDFICYVNDDMLGDAITASLDPTMADAEKAKQQAVLSTFYQGLSFMRSGGLFTDLERATDFRMNRIAADKITAMDIVWLLAHPDLTMYVYSRDGRRPISRAILCGDNSELACWDFLKAYPAVAMALRQHQANVAVHKEVECTTYLSAMPNKNLYNSMSDLLHTKEEDIVRRRVRARLLDMPEFGALIGISTPLHRMSSRTQRKVYANKVDSLVDFIIREAQKEGSIPAAKPAWFTVSSFRGISRSQKELEETAKDMSEAVNMMIEAAREALNGKKASLSGKPFEFKPDDSSFNMWSSVKANLVAAKTDISVGVEGAITREHEAMATYCAGRRDRYTSVDLYDVTSWMELDGAMTEFGIPLTMENASALEAALEEAKKDERSPRTGDQIFIAIPETAQSYAIQDPTLDPNEWRQTPSVGKFFTLLRDNSAESGNLQAAKSGDDGTHSISKHQRFNWNDPYRYMKEWDNYEADVRDTYFNAPAETRRIQACLCLAKYLKKFGDEAGHPDCTYADYVNVADLYIVEFQNEDGQDDIDIRSFGEISRIVRSELLKYAGASPMDGKRGIDEIVASPSSGTPDLSSICSGFRVASSVPFRPALRSRSSSITRNYMCMKEIMQELKSANREGKFFSVPVINRSVAGFAQRHPDVANKLRGIGFSTYWENGELIANTKDRAYTQKDANGNLILKGHSNALAYYDFQGFADSERFELNNSPGPETLWWADRSLSGDRLQQFLDTAYAYGITVAFDAGSPIIEDENLRYDCVPVENSAGEEIYILPFFDMRLNGSYTYNCYTQSGCFQADVDTETWFVESEVEVNADAGFSPFKWFLSRIKFKRQGVAEFRSEELFGDWIAENPEVGYDVSIATKTEVIMNLFYPKDGERAPISLGVIRESESYEGKLKRLEAGMEEYKANLGSVDDNGICVFVSSARDVNLNEEEITKWYAEDTSLLMNKDTINQDRIVGWAKLVGDNGDVRYAPLRMFPADKPGGPREYEIMKYDDRTINSRGRNRILINWKHETKNWIGKVAKVFEGGASGNKLTMSGNNAKEDRPLLNGIKLDGMYYAGSTAGRRLGYNKRIQTMITLMFAARRSPYGYNFMEMSRSFPNMDPATKKDFAANRKTMDDWKRVIPPESLDSYVFYKDGRKSPEKVEQMNRFLRDQVRKCYRYNINPSDFFASHFQGKRSGVYYQFELLFDSRPQYQSLMMSWMKEMMPTLCPKDTSAASQRDTTCLFRPDKDGVLRMQVPYQAGGRTYYAWECVYAGFSFLDRHYSGINRVKLNGSDKAMSSMVTAMMSGRMLGQDDWNQFVMHATAPEVINSGFYEPGQMEQAEE